MQRRDFLKYTSGLASLVLVDGVFAQSLWIPSAHGASIPLDSLYASLDPAQGAILVPGDAKFEATLAASNKRTILTPAVRVLCRTSDAVSICVQWATHNKVPLAMRAGGHSYEGFSQSKGIVIDTRMMEDITLSADNNTVTVGAGALLGQIYKKLSTKNRALPAGSCPTVGVTGHTTGGGYGLLARPLGLACDSLLSLEMINAQGELLKVNAQENADLFWACRGGGGGSFGIITKMTFKTHKVAQVATFTSRWDVNKSTAKSLLKAWQAWAPNAPSEITSLMNISKNNDGSYAVRCVGQSTGTEANVTAQLKKYVFNVKAPSKFNPRTRSWYDAVVLFAGSMDPVDPVYIKGKSDYVKQPTSDAGLEDIFAKMPTGIAVIFDSYGGAISNLGDQDTAFAHRSNTLCSVQYYAQWTKSSSTESKLATMRSYYEDLRPHFSGSAYVNYCDLDLKNYPQAYWGNNLNRLVAIKAAHDPQNFFKHAQSIPVN